MKLKEIIYQSIAFILFSIAVSYITTLSYKTNGSLPEANIYEWLKSGFK